MYNNIKVIFARQMLDFDLAFKKLFTQGIYIYIFSGDKFRT